MGRFTRPDRLIGATEFAKDAEVNNPLWLIRTLRQTAFVYRPLQQAVKGLAANWGRRRAAGEWALIYCAFVTSRIPDIQPWHHQTSEELWLEAGFSAKPPYSRVYARFCELEKVSVAFHKAAARLIQHARRHEPRIGTHVHWDSTESETHAALIHVCCEEKRGLRARRAKRPEREVTSAVRHRRQEAADDPVPERLVPVLGDIDKIRIREGRKQVMVNGHWYATLDETAGIRAYSGPRGALRFWHGFYNQKAIDHFTGAPLAVDDFNASTQEYYCYPELYEQLTENLGAKPETVIADRGFSVSSVFEANTRQNVASVIPWRAHGRQLKRKDYETHDRHGIPRCRHCGADSRFVRFSAAGGSPRLWFRCRLGRTPDCQKDQTIATKTDHRLLLPLWRTNKLYHQLQRSHESTERVHDDWRQRYQVGADNRSNRAKRLGIESRRLRSAAALLVEWLRICYREAWLGSARQSNSFVKEPNGAGDYARRSLLAYRRRKRITPPYGPAAHRLGFGPKSLPSERAGPKAKTKT